MPMGTPPEMAQGSAPRSARGGSKARTIAVAALALAGLVFGGIVTATALNDGGGQRLQVGSDTSYVSYGVMVARDGSPEPPTPTPSPTATPTQPPGGEAPGPEGITVWMDGDSTSLYPTTDFFALMTEHGATPARCARYVQASGLLSNFYQPLSGPCDNFSYNGWDSYLADEMALYDPDLVVLMISANDVTYGMDLEHYGERVGQVMDLICGQGRYLAYVGMTNYDTSKSAKAIELSSLRGAVNAVFVGEAAERPACVTYVDTSSVYADGYDGIHFSDTTAANPVARAIYDALYGQ